MALRSVLSDPMLKLLAGAVALAAFLPVGEAGQPIATGVANAAVFVLFLLNGMRIARSEIARGLRNWRFLIPLILWVFVGMAVVGWGMEKLGAGLLPPMIAVGFLYLGALPSTVQSATSYTSIAHGNVGMSVISAALLNILGVFVTVPIFILLGGLGEGAIGWETAERIALILLLPFATGQLVQGWTKQLIARHQPKIIWIDRFELGRVHV